MYHKPTVTNNAIWRMVFYRVNKQGDHRRSPVVFRPTYNVQNLTSRPALSIKTDIRQKQAVREAATICLRPM